MHFKKRALSEIRGIWRSQQNKPKWFVDQFYSLWFRRFCCKTVSSWSSGSSCFGKNLGIVSLNPQFANKTDKKLTLCVYSHKVLHKKKPKTVKRKLTKRFGEKKVKQEQWNCWLPQQTATKTKLLVNPCSQKRVATASTMPPPSESKSLKKVHASQISSAEAAQNQKHKD